LSLEGIFYGDLNEGEVFVEGNLCFGWGGDEEGANAEELDKMMKRGLIGDEGRWHSGKDFSVADFKIDFRDDLNHMEFWNLNQYFQADQDVSKYQFCLSERSSYFLSFLFNSPSPCSTSTS
jgi:hypothetical protein